VVIVNARVRQRACLIGATGLAALVAAPVAQAQTASVRPGNNISVFANIGFIAGFGYTVGSTVKVDLVRDGHVIASAGGPAVDTPDGGALEVNHGPEGAPQPGDCWTNYTPRVLPGDEVRITGDGGTDTALVDDIRIAGAPYLSGDDVIVEGTARYADQIPIPATLATLDSGEVRNANPRVRANPTAMERIPGTDDGWRATYEAAQNYGVFSNPGNVGAAAVRGAILNPDVGHSMGYGHTAPLPAVTQLADGIGDQSGPALGCEASRLAPQNAITTLSDDVVNIASGDLTVGGVSTAATEVSVTLDDENGTTAPVEVAATEGVSGAWSATVSRAQLESLDDGTLTVSAGFGDATLSLPKDTAAPRISATPAPGTYTGTRHVGLNSDDVAGVFYTLDGGASRLYNGTLVEVGVGTHTIVASSTDAAGNPTETRFVYVIGAPADPPAAAGAGGGQGAVLTTAPTAPSGLAGPAATGSAARKQYLRSFATAPRVKRSRASKRGIRVIMRVADDAALVRVRVYRVLKNGARLLIATTYRVPSKAGLFKANLNAPILRRKLRVGNYEVDATPGASRIDLGTTSRYRFKVVRG